MNFDIIGDVHGHADELEKLLEKLGYQLSSGIYRHPGNRKVIFLGDFIDRGPKIRETLHIAKNMCDNGSAMTIMGNHEFNAICFHTADISNGGFYRKHNFKEIKQHYKTLKEFNNFPKEWQMFTDWFKTLPMFLEEAHFRVVHACWDDNHINWIKQNVTGFTDDFLSSATAVGNKEYQVIEETLKGKEAELPPGNSFLDKDGNKREECRVKWWQPMDERAIYGDLMMACPEKLYDEPLEQGNSYYSYESDTPVFFGHYWLEGLPVLKNPKAICLDYSVAKGGALVAFRSEYLDHGDIAEGFVY